MRTDPHRSIQTYRDFIMAQASRVSLNLAEVVGNTKQRRRTLQEDL
jgi:hypothetical protein